MSTKVKELCLVLQCFFFWYILLCAPWSAILPSCYLIKIHSFRSNGQISLRSASPLIGSLSPGCSFSGTSRGIPFLVSNISLALSHVWALSEIRTITIHS